MPREAHSGLPPPPWRPAITPSGNLRSLLLLLFFSFTVFPLPPAFHCLYFFFSFLFSFSPPISPSPKIQGNGRMEISPRSKGPVGSSPSMQWREVGHPIHVIVAEERLSTDGDEGGLGQQVAPAEEGVERPCIHGLQREHEKVADGGGMEDFALSYCFSSSLASLALSPGGIARDRRGIEARLMGRAHRESVSRAMWRAWRRGWWASLVARRRFLRYQFPRRSRWSRIPQRDGHAGGQRILLMRSTALPISIPRFSVGSATQGKGVMFGR